MVVTHDVYRDSGSRNVRGGRFVGRAADLHFAAPKRLELAPLRYYVE